MKVKPSLSLPLCIWSLAANGEIPKVRLAWVREGAPAVLEERIEKLPAGAGCLAAVADRFAPQWAELTLPKDQEKAAALLHPRGGAKVWGSVQSHDLTVFVPEVSLSPGPGVVPPLCWQALKALGWESWPTDRAGNFSVELLPPGKWSLELRAPFHLSARVEVEVHTNQKEIHLPAQKLTPRAYVNVSVQASGSTPYTLVVEKIEQEPSGRMTFKARQEIPLDANPIALQLEPGPYRFHLKHPQIGVVWLHSAKAEVGEQTITVKPQPIEVDGRLKSGSHGVEGAKLLFAVSTELVATAHTGPAGEFQFAVPRPGNYLLDAILPDGRQESFLLDLLEVGYGEKVTRDLELAERWLSVLVVDNDGQPVSEAQAFFHFTLPDHKGDFWGNMTANREGRFSIPLKPGAGLELKVGKEGFLPLELRWPSQPPEELTVRLEKGLAVEGIVVTPSGNPVPGANVQVTNEPFGGIPLYATKTRDDGRFTLTVPPGSFLLAWQEKVGLGWCLAQAHSTITLLPPGPTSTFWLKTQEGETFGRGQVALSTPEGVVIPHGVFSELQRASGSVGESNQAGRLTITGLPAGTYTLFVRTKDGRVWWSSVVLPTDQSLRLKPAQ